MIITIKKSDVGLPSGFCSESADFTLRLELVEELAGIGVYQPSENEYWEEYSIFVTEILKQFGTPIYLTFDGIDLLFINKETTLSDLESLRSVSFVA